MMLVAVVAAILGIANADSNSYCTINPQNTLCLNTNTSMGSNCAQLIPIQISASDKQTIIDLHNNLRRKVAQGQETKGNPGPQPQAANMRQMVWDDELAMMAQTHANQCVYKHDANRNVQRFNVGQNIAIQMGTNSYTSADWTSPINDWYSEVSAMDKAYVNSFPSNPTGVIGHYTQVIWANSYTVGCGVVSYYDAKFYQGYPYNIFYVCNYGPAGNFLGTPVYIQGPAASACPPGTTASNGLCV